MLAFASRLLIYAYQSKKYHGPICKFPVLILPETPLFRNLVTYHIHQSSSFPSNDALAYQYVLAGTGIYLCAEKRFFNVLLPLARYPIRGLAPLQPHFTL